MQALNTSCSSIPIDSGQFDRYVIKAKQDLPVDKAGKPIDLCGAIGLIRDSKHEGWLHQLIYLVQKIHAKLFGRQADPDFSHVVVVLGHDKQKKDHLIVAHSAYEGIRTETRAFVHEDCITEFVIYVPKNEKLRDLICKYGKQTAYIDPNDHGSNKQIPGFSLLDLAKSFMYNRPQAIMTAREIKRTSYLVADLLLGNQILDKKGKAKSFHCTAYALSILQGSLLVSSLNRKKRQKLTKFKGMRSRDEVAKLVQEKLKMCNPTDKLSDIFWRHRVCQLNARFTMTSYAAGTFDELT